MKNVEDIYPLSPLQQGLLFHALMEPDSPAYTNQCSLTLGRLDVPLFRQTWEHAVARHATLRTAFLWQGLKEPLQVVRQRVTLPWEEHDWRALPPGERSRRLEALRAAQRSRPLALDKAPLLRFALLRLEDDAYELIWTFHHLLLDGWSTPLLFAEVLAIYRALGDARQPALPPVRPYRDYIAWLQRQDLGLAERFWRRYLAGFTAPTPLALDRPARAAALSSVALAAALAPAAAVALHSLLARHRLTLSSLAQGAWALLLARYSGEEDVVLGSVVAGRPADLAGVESMIGLFINTLPARVRVAGRQPALAWLEELQQQQLEARQFEHSPLSRVQGWSDLPRGTALFDSILACEIQARDTPPSAAGQAGAGIRVARIRNVELTGYALSATVAAHDGLAVEIAYDPARCDAASIARRLAQLCNLLAGLAAAPAARVEDLPLLAAAERHQLLLEWSAGGSTGPGDAATFIRRFAMQASRRPEAVAVCCADAALSYRELDARAGRWARLLAGWGVGPDTVVALLAERGLPLLTAILAVHKAGGAYLPLDPNHPAARQHLVLARSRATLALVERRLRAELPPWRPGDEPAPGRPAVLEIEQLAARDATPLTAWCGPRNLAYVIYTSGSTGVPKGAMVEQRGMLNHLDAKIAALGLGAADVVAQSASQCFDVSVWQLLAALLVGGRVEIAADHDAQDPQRLLALTERAAVTILETVPSQLRGLLEMLETAAVPAPRLASLRWLLVTGEAFPAELARRWLALYPGVAMLNAYGPTECSDDVTHWALYEPPPGEAAQVAVGRPLANLRIDLLDRRLRPVPAGAAGELCVGGVGVGRGYLGEPARTAELFVPDPQGGQRGEPGGRLYRTGDLGRHSAAGVLELLGRIDHQVKVRGYRIELGEIEAALALHPGVRMAAVLAREDVPGQVRLVAYVVAAAAPLAAEELRGHLRGRLPEHMVPWAVVELLALPLLPSGKVDRRALPAPSWQASAATQVAPRNPVEETLAKIWREVLRQERLGVHDSFFELGGDSILSIQILSRASRAGLRLTARQIFEHPTIAELAVVAQAATQGPGEDGPVAGPVPLTPIQGWFFEQRLSHAHHFNQAVLLEVLPDDGGGVRPALLRRAVAHLLAHHDALRMRFEPPAAGRPAWRQVAGGTGEVPCTTVDLSALPAERWQAGLRQAAATLQGSLDLERGPLLRAALLPRTAGRPDHLLLLAHHLVIDGVSWRILLEDLEAVYRQASRREAPELPPKTTSYRRWAEQLAVHARSAAVQGQASWWLDRLQRPVPRLPVDDEAGDDLAGSARSVTVALGSEETRALLQEVPRAYRTQIQEVLLAALAEALARWTGCRRQLIHLEGHGREELFDGVDVSRTVGWFTAIFPVLLDLEGVTAPGAALRAVKEQLRAVPDRGIGYGLLRYLAGGQAEASLRARLRPEVLFNYLGQLDAVVAPQQGFLRPARTAAGDATDRRQQRPHLLEVNGSVAGGCLRMAWTYGANRHRRATIQALADGFATALRGLIAHCRTIASQGVESYTPSDFPLARLDQVTLDRVVPAGMKIDDLYPASPVQQGMLYHTLRAPGSGVYIEQLSLMLGGELDVAAFQRAWQAVVERHPVLRTAFFWRDVETPLQRVHRQVTLPWECEDWSATPAAERRQRLAARLAADRRQGIDLARAPLMRFALLRTGSQSYQFLWTFHHVLLDGWSMPILLRDLFALYESGRRGAAAGLPPARTYRHYIAWLSRQDMTAAEAFWRRSLAGFVAATPLAAGHAAAAGPDRRSTTGAREHRLSAPATQAVRALARRQQLTLNTLVQGAWALLLSRYGGGDDVVFGAVTSGRAAPVAGIEETVGLFINTLPARVRVQPAADWRDWLREVQEQQLEMRQYEHSPQSQVQGWSEVPRGLPLFESVLAFENYPVDAAMQRQAGEGLGVRGGELLEQTHYPLTLAVVAEARLDLRLLYEAERFEPAVVARLLAHLETLLAGMAAHAAGAPLAALSLLSAGERQQLLVEWNAPAALPLPGCLHELFAARAAGRPGAVAVVCEAEHLSYGELAARANRLAHRLRRLGVGPEVPVGLCLERSLDMVVAIVGALAAGGAYLPLDPAYPAERLAGALADARPPVVVTQQRLLGVLPQTAARVLCLDGPHEALDRESADPPAAGAVPDNLAYVIFTSGSTGRPKGSLLTHRNAVRLFAATAAWFGFGEHDVWTLFHSYAFDFSVWELWGALLHGGRLVVVPHWLSRSPAELQALLRREGVTVLNQTPSAFYQLAQAEHDATAPVELLHTVILGGEALDLAALAPWLARHGHRRPRLVNMYGITETTVHVTYRPITGDDLPPGRDPAPFQTMPGRDPAPPQTMPDRDPASLLTAPARDPAARPGAWRSPIGTPIPDLRLHVLDGHGDLAPAGVPGEIHVAGDGLGRGYLGRPELTAERFVPDPFSRAAGGGAAAGERLYRTGDLARRTTTGDLDYLGRIDRQVKIRGFRIELGEIEAVLSQSPGVSASAVEPRRLGLGDLRLTAFLVPDEAAVVARGMLRLGSDAASRRPIELPNGMPVFHLNRGETEFLFAEIFTRGEYLRHGVELGPEPCVFDVGANVGMFSLYVAGLRPRARIHAFEPIPETFEALRRNVELYGIDARLYDCGLAAAEQQVELTHYPYVSVMSGRLADAGEERAVVRAFLTRTQALDGLSSRQIDELLDARLESVKLVRPLRRLSDVVREQGVERIDLLKIDVEKSELEVLAGIDEDDWPKIRQVVVEVHDVAGRLDSVRSLLGRHGFHLTVTQETSLAATGLFNVYATRAAGRAGGGPPAFAVPAAWWSPERLIAGARQTARRLLPDHMVPAAFVLVPALPLAASGKVDRRALSTLDAPPAGAEAEAETEPRRDSPSPFAELLRDIFATVLQRQEVGLEDDFFELGGHSLLATRLMSRVAQVLGVELPLRTVFEAPTVRALAAHVERAAGAGGAARGAAIERVPRDHDLPLSFAQQRLWFLHRLDPDSPAYNVPSAVRLAGRLDAAALARSLTEIVRRHEVLRTSFPAAAGEPRQEIAAAGRFALPRVDLGALPAARRWPEALRLLRAEARRPLPLATGPLLRALLLALEPAVHAVVLVMHHIVSDGWSMGLFMSELQSLYGAFARGLPSQLPELEIQYADFASWQRRQLGGEALAAELAYWCERLAGAPPLLLLPTDRPRPASQTFAGRGLTSRLPAALSAALRAFSRRHGVTLFMTLVAAFQALLSRCSGQADVVVGTPIAGRGHWQTEPMIGLFLNALPLRTDLAGKPGFAALAGRVREVALSAYAHQQLPFEQLVEELAPERDLGYSPLFQAMINLLNFGDAPAALPGLAIEPVALGEPASQLDLSLDVVERRSPVEVERVEMHQVEMHWVEMHWVYSMALFDAPRIARLAGHLASLLRAGLEDPRQPVGELPLLDAGERHQLVVEWNDTAMAVAGSGCLSDLVAAPAARAPHRVAIACGDQALSYGELERRAGCLAHRLRRQGVGPETPVAILAERAPATVIAVLGVLQAGGACVPLDPELPAERLAYVLADSRAAILLARDPATIRLDGFAGRVLSLADGALSGSGISAPQAAVQPDAVAYVVYTSGTTGRPKGVLATHRGAASYLAFLRTAHGLHRDDRVLQLPSLAFDAAVRDLLGPLAAGATVVLTRPEEARDPAALLRLVEQRDISRLLSVVPTLLRGLLAEAAAGAGAGTVERRGVLRQILVSGERLYLADCARAREVFGEELAIVNQYGPTECAMTASFHRVEAAGAGRLEALIGRPIGNRRFHLLDGHLEPVPLGVVGQLHIGGEGLARGYLGRPELTAERFVPDPCGPPGSRCYATGDLVRCLHGGELEFLGRADHQVKLRGYRVEPEEIEAVLRAAAGVRQAAVVLQEDGDGLAACVVAVPGATLDPGALRGFLDGRLPAYMVPARFVVLDALPVTATGKVDRRLLAARLPPREVAATAPARPLGPIEELLAGIFAEVLGREQVASQDNFFALGGHSLLVMRVLSRVRATCGAEVPLRSLFQHPTVAGLAGEVQRRLQSTAGLEAPPLGPAPAGEPLPLSFAQQRLWFLDQLQPDSAMYNMPLSVRLAGPLDVAALAAAFTATLARHAVLRTRFEVVAGEPWQRLDPARASPLPVVDLGGVPAGLRRPEVQRLAAAEARRPFDLRRGPLLRVTLLVEGRREHRVLVTMHHIASDAWSMEILVRELAALYAAGRERRPSPLPGLAIQYADFAHWQRRWLRGEVLAAELAYWRQQLAAMAPGLDLPGDRPRPTVQSHRGESFWFPLPGGLGSSLAALSRQRSATLFMTLLAAFQSQLSRYTGQDDMRVGTAVAGRDRLEIEPLIGFFVNTLVLRTDLAGEPTFQQLLERVREVTLAAYAHQALPFEKLVEELHPQRDLGHTPLFQVMFELQNLAPQTPRPAGRDPALLSIQAHDLAMESLPVESGAAKFDLTVIVAGDGDALRVEMQYSRDLFDVATVQRMGGHFRHLLARIAAAPEQRVALLPLLAAGERQQLLVEWNAPAARPLPGCLHELFAARAAARPGAVAVVCEAESLTYGELAARANRLAHRLRRLGVGPEVPVGLCLERSLDMVVAIVGTLAAGGAYLPLDPAYPAERLAGALADARPPVVVTQQRLLGVLPQTAARVLCLDGPHEALDRESADPPAAGAVPDNLAYVIFTSGSTGRPKGSLLTHRNAVRLFAATAAWFGFGEHDVWTLFHSYAFDFSVWELWGALLHGGRLVVVPHWLSRSPAELQALLLREGVTVLNQTPSAFYQLAQVEHDATAPVELLHTVILGGEALDLAALAPWLARHGHRRPRLVNMYGITETTVHVTYRPITGDDLPPGRDRAPLQTMPGRDPASLLTAPARDPAPLQTMPHPNPAPRTGAWRSPIGAPIPDLRLHVLDRHGDLAPVGVPGEIHVAGDGLGRGYLGRPELTAERFVPDPFSRAAGGGAAAGERLYRTGDLARRTTTGDLDYLGRIDRQVKIRGFRIEPGEIEAALLRDQAVQAAVVLLAEEATGERRLVAYVVPRPEAAADAAALRAALRASLPDHMLPAAFVLLPALPLDAGGKLDRGALAAIRPQPQGAGAAVRQPPDVVTGLLQEIFAGVLQVDEVGPADDFFALGGHSLLATQLAARIREAFRVELPLRSLFEHPQVAQLAAAIALGRDTRAGGAAPLALLAQRAPRDRWLPLSGAQQQLWSRSRRAPGDPASLKPMAFHIGGALDEPALQATLSEIARRHEILRTALLVVDGEAVGSVAAPGAIGLPRIDLAALPDGPRWSEAKRLWRAEARRPFDLGRAPLMRAAVVRLAPQERIVLLTLHQVSVDGWSMGILVREVRALYEAFSQARPSPLPELGLQYADFAWWQRQWLAGVLDAELAYWRGRLGSSPEPLRLPTDRPRPAHLSTRGGRCRFAVPAELLGRLKGLSRQRGASLFMTLLASCQTLLSRYTGQEEISVGTPMSGRNHVQVESLIGPFANTLVLRTSLAGELTFTDLLVRAREVALAAYAHQSVQFERLAQELDPDAGPAGTPLFQAWFSLTPRDGDLELPEVRVGMLRTEDADRTSFDLSLPMVEEGGRLGGALILRAELFDRVTIERMTAHLLCLLAAVAEAPDRPLAELSLLSAAERHLLRVEWGERGAVATAGEEDRSFLGAIRNGRSPSAVGASSPPALRRQGAGVLEPPPASGSARGEDGWSAELRATHLELSAADLHFRELALREQVLRRRSTFHVLDGDRRLKYRQQPWPTFIGRAKLEQLAGLTLALARLIRGVPRRIFQNHAERICEFYRMPSGAMVDIMLSEPNCIEESMGRADLIDTADGFKCIEFNFSPNLGGWETSLLAELHGKVPEVAGFMERQSIRLSYTSTLQVMFRHVIAQAERRGLCARGEINVVCAFSAADLAEPSLDAATTVLQRELERACREAATPLRGQVIACHYSQLVTVQGMLFHGRTQVHAILELCPDVAPPAVCRSFKAGKLLLFNGPISPLLIDKSNLALLSEHQGAGVFSPQEQEVIRKHIPWTRRVAAARAQFEGEEVWLPDLLAAERCRLVLKEGRSSGGRGVYLGLATPPAVWEEVVRKALDGGGWVVQERLESLPYLYQCGDEGCVPHDVIWGPFVFGDVYGGVILRMQPKAARGVVNANLGATEGIVLEV